MHELKTDVSGFKRLWSYSSLDITFGKETDDYADDKLLKQKSLRYFAAIFTIIINAFLCIVVIKSLARIRLQWETKRITNIKRATHSSDNMKALQNQKKRR